MRLLYNGAAASRVKALLRTGTPGPHIYSGGGF